MPTTTRSGRSVKPSLASSLERLECHQAWNAWQEKQEGPEPPMGYLDCSACPLRRAASDEEERRAYCGDCPYDQEDLPRSLDPDFLTALGVMGLPVEAVTRWIDSLTEREMRALQMLRDRRERSVMEAMMARSLGGGSGDQ